MHMIVPLQRLYLWLRHLPPALREAVKVFWSKQKLGSGGERPTGSDFVLGLKTVLVHTYFSFLISVLVRFVLMLALNLWVTATVLRYRKTVVKAE